MSVEEQVDRLLQKDDKKVVVKHFKFNRNHFFIAFGSMVVTALLFTMLVVPVSREWMEETFFGVREQTIVPSAGGTIINGSVTWSNDYGTLTVTPDVSRNIITQEQEALFESNITNNIDVAFRFDDSIDNKDIWMWRNISHNVSVPDYGYKTRNYTLVNISDFEVIGEPPSVMLGDIPSDYYAIGNASWWDEGLIEWWNTTFTIGFDSWAWLNPEHTEANFTYEYWGQTGSHLEEQFWFDWKDISSQFNHQIYNGKHYYYVSDVPVVQGKSYLFKWQYDIPLVNFKSNGKWDLMAKLHSDDIPTALATGRYIMIDPWWDSDWLYSKVITITNPLDDYQTKIIVANVSGGDVDCEGHANSDFSDVRFTNATNTSELPYWIENFTSNVVATIWVNNTWNESTINMYYGNSSAINNSDGNLTFDFFDDFLGAGLSTEWTDASAGNGVISVSGGRIRLQATEVAGSPNHAYCYSNQITASPCALTVLGLDIDTVGNIQIQLNKDTAFDDEADMARFLYYDATTGGGGNLHSRYSIKYAAAEEQSDDDEGAIDTFNLDSNDILINNLRIVEFLEEDISQYTTTNSIDDETWRIRLYATEGRGSCDVYINTVFLRKYNTTEPSFAFGSEQSRDTVTITLIDYMPTNIRTNNTGSAWFLYNITTNSTSINPYSIIWAYGVNHTVSITRNTSYSLEDHLAKNKLRGNNRNENMTIESKFNATAGDGSIGELGEWNVHELGNDVTIVDSGSNWTLVNASEPITEHLFSSISFVDNEDINLENKTTQTLNIYKRNLVKIEFNMTDTGWYNDGHYKNSSMFVHIYANETDANRPLNIFYANSSYTTGDVTNSLYCELVGEVIPNEAYHFTIENSSYYEKDFIINATGFVGSVNATSKYYIILQSETPSSKPWFLHYADGNDTHVVDGDSHYHDFDNRTIVNVTSDDGGSWSANSSTPDVYFNYISLDEEDASEVKLYANDTSGNSAWSSVHTDIIDITNYAPSPANIHIPNVNTNYTVGDTISINYNWIGDPNFDTCWVNVSLWDWTRSVLQSYIVNQSITNVERMANNSNFTYNWDTTGVSRSNYTIAINITDGSMWANHSSDIFWLSLWQVINSTVNGSVFNQSQVSLINSSINGSLYNTSQITTFNNSINGSAFNQSQYSVINNTYNGSVYNQSQYSIINNTYNGSLYNSSALSGLNTTVDAISPYNQTASPLEITASVAAGNETPDNVTLYYRYSSDNSTWDNETGAGAVNGFGFSGTPDSYTGMENDIRAVVFKPSSNGTANNMTVYLKDEGGVANVTLALLNNDTNALVGETENRIIDTGVGGWYVFDFVVEPDVNTSTDYLLAFWDADNGSDVVKYYFDSGTPNYYVLDNNNQNQWDWTTFNRDTEAGGRTYCIYCNYTESIGGSENWTNYGIDETAPWNWSFNFPNSTGYYEFYSIANKSGQANETAPDYNDTLCYFDLEQWILFSDTVNGSLYNLSAYSLINNSINGTLYNGTGITTEWQIFNNSINGTLYNESAQWQVINNSINGSLYNSSIDVDVDYYVSNAGNDNNLGTSTGSPWLTIAKVNTEMNGVINQGDDVYFRRGDTWSEGISLQPRKGGSESEQMVIGAYGSGDRPVLINTNNHGISGIRMDIGNTGWYTFEYLNVSNAGNDAIFITDEYTHNLTFRYITIWNPYDYGIILRFVQTLKIENCDAYSCGSSGFCLSGSGAGSTRLSNSKIWNCTSIDGKDGYVLHYRADENAYLGSNHWIENCTADIMTEAGLDVTIGSNPSANVYVNNCVFSNCSQGGIAAGHDTRNETYENIQMYDNGQFGFGATKDSHLILRYSIIKNWANSYSGVIINQNIDNRDTHNITMYNNNFISEGDYDHVKITEDVDESGETRDLIFKNNIFSSTGATTPTQYVNYIEGQTSLSSTRSNWTYNMWYRYDNDQNNHWRNDIDVLDFTEWIAEPEVSDELWDDPEFEYMENNNFDLNSTSPCIDAGDWLTFTVGAGTNKNWVTVDESHYFFDGYGFDDLSGDKIFVGSNIGLEIVEIDYYNDSFQVNRSISWSDGDDVSLYNYSGAIVDIGAREFSSVTYWRLVNSSINGSVYNTSQFSVVNNSINGSLWNVTRMQVFNQEISGSLYNQSDIYVILNNTYNGSLFNGTGFKLLFENINGSLWNVSDYVNIFDTINGVIYNTTPYTTIQDDINGSIFNTSLDPYIDNVYPANGSNILVVQPTVYFNLTSPLGLTMNYSIYIGDTASSCNTLIHSETGVSNGTQFNSGQLYYSAVNFSTSYWWRIAVTDGTASINETFYFQSLRQGGGGVTGYGAAMAIATGALMLVVVVFALVMDKKRKERI